MRPYTFEIQVGQAVGGCQPPFLIGTTKAISDRAGSLLPAVTYSSEKPLEMRS